MGNWCLVGKILDFVVEAGAGCLALFFGLIAWVFIVGYVICRGVKG
jgi:hypothetical protein